MINDFEIHATLRADVLECHVPPGAQTAAEEVQLTREERSGASPNLEAEGRYEDVAIERSVLGITSRPDVEVAQPTRRSRKRPKSRPRNVARPR